MLSSWSVGIRCPSPRYMTRQSDPQSSIVNLNDPRDCVTHPFPGVHVPLPTRVIFNPLFSPGTHPISHLASHNFTLRPARYFITEHVDSLSNCAFPNRQCCMRSNSPNRYIPRRLGQRAHERHPVCVESRSSTHQHIQSHPDIKKAFSQHYSTHGRSSTRLATNASQERNINRISAPVARAPSSICWAKYFVSTLLHCYSLCPLQLLSWCLDTC